MTNPVTSGEGNEVGRLFAERQRFEGWLNALEARRAATPPHIYDRVRTDYEGRLGQVFTRLAERRAEIQGMADALIKRLTALDADEQRQRDERVEAELRAAIGELTPEESQQMIRRGEEALGTLAGERATVSSELSRLHEVLERAGEDGAARRSGREGRAARSLEPPSPRGETPPELAAALRNAAAAPSTPPGAQTPTVGAGFDEMAFLKSVVDTRPRSGGGSAPSGDAPSFAKAGATPSGAAPVASEEGRKDATVPAFLRDVPAEQVKTLKCQECATMNYPTEWYCERCGSELAAL
ncbi:MAG: hypothetical protein WKG32_00050 [Gemmatimonadaceae bacterium]